MFHRENSSLVREFAVRGWSSNLGERTACASEARCVATSKRKSGHSFKESAPRSPKFLSAATGPLLSLTGGLLQASIPRGQIAFLNQKGEIVLEEFMRVRLGNMEKGDGQIDQAAITYFNSALSIYPREFKPTLGGDYALTVRFESRPEEKLFGMGQYQHGFLDQKNCVLELAQRNSQASVPFALSSLGYGFLWNNPAIGKVSFGKNYTEWTGDIHEADGLLDHCR